MAWLIFLYWLPPTPSRPRVAAWRALKRLPGGYLQDGTYAAPASEATEVQLRILAHDIRNEGGKASILYADRVDDERHLKARLAEATKPKDPQPPRKRAPSKKPR